MAIISARDALVSHVPTDEIAEPVEAVTGNGHFWVANLDPPSTVEIDPTTGAILRRLGSVFPGEPGWPLPDGRDIWFSFGADLVRVNLAESRAVDRYPMTTARNRLGLGWVARCSGSLWVADNKEHAVVRVDPATGAVQARITTQYRGRSRVATGMCGLRRTGSGCSGSTQHEQDRRNGAGAVPERHPCCRRRLCLDVQRDERDGVQGRRAR